LNLILSEFNHKYSSKYLIILLDLQETRKGGYASISD